MVPSSATINSAQCPQTVHNFYRLNIAALYTIGCVQVEDSENILPCPSMVCAHCVNQQDTMCECCRHCAHVVAVHML